ncbi:MAG: hypothetical protein HQK77_14180 [Desulfobacterales bacterium]|nr:hypothetical protein [Desulfobacterales bacterium]
MENDHDEFLRKNMLKIALIDQIKSGLDCEHKLRDEQVKTIYEGVNGLNSKVSYKLWNWSISIITIIFLAIGSLLWSLSMTSTRIEANQLTSMKALDDIKKDIKEIQYLK